MRLDVLRLLRRDGELEHDTAIVDSAIVRARGGARTGPGPIHRGKPGCQHRLMTV